MGFHEVRFPDDISYDSGGGPGFNTAIITSQSGREERVQRWSAPRWQFNVAYGIRSKEQLAALKAFYIARAGAAFGFRYKDWTDFSTAANDVDTPSPTDQLIGIGNGVDNVFQLRKKYESGATLYWRKITKPVDESVMAAVAGVTESGFTVDTTAGTITLSSIPANGAAVTAGCEFDVPVRFGEEIDKTLTLTLDDFGIGSSENIPLIELVEESTADEEFNFRGAHEELIAANTVVSEGRGFVQAYSPQVDALALILQDPTDLAPGGPKFHLLNEGATFDLEVRDEASDLLCVMAPGQGCFVSLSVDSGGDKTWYSTT